MGVEFTDQFVAAIATYTAEAAVEATTKAKQMQRWTEDDTKHDTQHDLFEWHTSVRPRQHVSALGRMRHEEDNHRRDGAVPYLLYGHPIHFFVHSVCSTSSYVGGHDIFLGSMEER